IDSWRAERSGSPSVTSANAKSCSSFKACDGRSSTAIRARPDRFGTELFQNGSPSSSSTSCRNLFFAWGCFAIFFRRAARGLGVPFLEQRIERARNLALAAVGTPRPRGGGAGREGGA